MLDSLKKKMLNKGMELMASPAVGKLMQNEKVGVVLEKAMTVPFKVSGAVASHKERLVSMFDLATQDDVDEIKRTVSRMEGVLNKMKKESKKSSPK